MPNATDPIIVVEIGGEGGSIKLLARSDDNKRPQYSVTMRDHTLTLLAEDEAGNTITRTTDWTSSWDDAIAALGRWPWPMLHPIQVHPNFRERILVAIQGYRDASGRSAAASAVSRWTEACGSSEVE